MLTVCSEAGLTQPLFRVYASVVVWDTVNVARRRVVPSSEVRWKSATD